MNNFFFNDTATTEIYTLSLHDALPISIKDLKAFFEKRLGEELELTRVSSPLFVLPETGTNDNLNGVEKAVSFEIKDMKKRAERSEEHTSELQSRQYLVCRLLLEKKSNV